MCKHSLFKYSNFKLNVMITWLDSTYNYSNLSLISRNLCKFLLCPCTLLCLNKNIAKTIPAARLNA